MGCWVVEAVFGYENQHSVTVPFQAKSTFLGRILDDLKEEIRVVLPGKVTLRPRRIPERERQLARAGCGLAIIILIGAFLSFLVWWCRRV
jgi:hypothetical protein